MQKIDNIILKVIALFRGICSVLLVLTLSITGIHVLFRYVFNNPLIWSEEASLLLLIWFGFFSIANELYFEDHIAIVMFYEKLPVKVQRGLDIIRHLVVASFCTIMTYYLIIITNSIIGNTLPVSGLPKILMYIPVIIASILMVIYSLLLFIKSLFLKTYNKEELK
ncbi:TRAP transporter small permease [Vallitaleaceae bacterium 9-2]